MGSDVESLGNMLSRNKRTNDLSKMIEATRPFLVTLGKAKAARMVRDLVDTCLKIDQDGDIKVALVEESIGWATGQNHNFLRQALQARLIRLLNDLGRYPNALKCGLFLIPRRSSSVSFLLVDFSCRTYSRVEEGR